MSGRRVVVTGIGMMSALGTSRDVVWRRMLAGDCGIGEVSLFDATGYRSRMAAEIPAYAPMPSFSPKAWARMSRSDQTALIASRESLDDAVAMVNKWDAFVPGDSRAVGEPWGSWGQNVESWVEGADDTLLAVRYEDMLDQPTETFARIVAHLRQKATPAQLSEAIRLSAFDELKSQEEKRGFHLRQGGGGEFFASGKTGVWREALTAAQADAIVEAQGETMRKFGYLD